VKPHKFFYFSLLGGWTLARAADPAPPVAPAGSPPASVAAQPAATTPGMVRVGGSDLLQTAVGEPLAHYVKQARLEVKVDLQGSVPALNALKDGTIQLAILTAPVGQEPAPKGFKVIPLCFAVDYILVNPANPLNALDLRQLAAVFGENEQGGTTWGELQASADWAAKPVAPCATSTDDGLVIEMFKNEMLGGNALKGTVQVMKTAQTMVKTVAENPNAIGLGGYDPGASSKVKVLLISSANAPVTATSGLTTGGSKGAASPTPENVASGAYPLRLPFYLVYKPADQARVQQLLQLLLSDEYAARLQAEHFVPVPDTARSRARLELDNPG
jgi:phosphate transport system substrate-binding protein